MSKNGGKLFGTQVTFQARDCHLHHSKQGNGCFCGTVQTGNFFWDTRYFSISLQEMREKLLKCQAEFDLMLNPSGILGLF